MTENMVHSIPPKPWQPLRPGDIVDVIAPGYGAGAEHLKKAADFIASLGLVARIPEDLIRPHLFCSNSDAERLRHTQAALYAKDSKAVWCLKGGYGTAALIPELMKHRAPTRAKLLMGFSDITALHLLLAQRWGWTTLHAPVLWQITAEKISQDSIERLTRVIFGKAREVEYTLEPLPSRSSPTTDHRPPTTVTGGNMAILQTGIGTKWHPNTAGKIFFIEEVDEKPYRVSRMFTHFRQAGLFDAPTAVILGDFTIEEAEQEAMETMLQDFASTCAFPVFRLHGIGHEATNYPLPINSPTRIITGKRITLTCDTGVAEQGS